MNTSETTPSERLLQPVTARLFWYVMGPCLIYAGVRYHIVQDVPWSQAPLFILNKAISLGGLAFLALSYLVGKISPLRWDDRRIQLIVIKFCGLVGFSLIAAHVFMSLALLDPAYYAKFYDGLRFNLTGELSLSLGVFAVWCFAMPVISSLPYMYDELGADRWLRAQRTGYIGLFLAAGHVLVMGVSGWMKPGDWPAGLPPITVLAFVIAVVPLIFLMLRKKHKD